MATENVKQGREHALMGRYSESEVSYVEAVRNVSELIKQIHDPDKRQKWREVIVGVNCR